MLLDALLSAFISQERRTSVELLRNLTHVIKVSAVWSELPSHKQLAIWSLHSISPYGASRGVPPA